MAVDVAVEQAVLVVRFRPEVLVVDLRNERWDRFVLEVPDPHAAVTRIEAARSG